MPKNSFQNLNTSNFIPSFFLIAYLCLGFVPNWDAVDKIAPQWLLMNLLNVISLGYILYFRNKLSLQISNTIGSTLSYTYIGFIGWAALSYFYAINSIEVIVNITRQVNVLMMFIVMGILIYNFKEKRTLVSYVITAILAIEVYAVLNEALQMINTSGFINSGNLKGVTANRNITAFSIAIKIPFVVFLLYKFSKPLFKVGLSGIILLSILCLSLIQSRASFLALAFTSLSFLVLCVTLYLNDKNRRQLYQFTYFLIPLFLAIGINQVFFSDKGADALARASTISAGTNDDSVNQRLRYYEDVLTHLSSNPIFGVGLGNWKIKSIDYDSEDIVAYVVPYHAHSDFIQLGAELGIIGFLLYLGVFLWAIYYVYFLIRFSSISTEEKIFLFLMLTALGVYTVDANLNFPIARPQSLVVWTMIIALINFYYQKNFKSLKHSNSRPFLNYSFLGLAIITIIPSVYVTNNVFKSLKGQMYMLRDFNSNQFNVPINKIDALVPEIPNITVTTIPINSMKARYYVNAGKYEKALALIEKGTHANPYLYYSELLKSQIFIASGKMDSAKVYAKKSFFGLPNNALHSSNYLRTINQTRDRESLEEAFEMIVFKNDINNWRNYLTVASNLYPPNDKKMTAIAKQAAKLFPQDQTIQVLYRSIVVGSSASNEAAIFSGKALEFFNLTDYKNAAINFEKAYELNPLEFSYYENAATSNYLLGNLGKALLQINEVINKLNPLTGKCEYIKALIFIKMGDPIGACPLLKTAKDSGHYPSNNVYAQNCNQ